MVQKEQLVAKAQRKLAINNPYADFDNETVGDYVDEAVAIILDWKKAKTDSIFDNNKYDREIVNYVVESINWAGNEGVSHISGNGSSKDFIASPADNLKKSIPQSI